MSPWSPGPRWQAGLIAAVLFGLGVVAGVVADRAWMARSAGAAPAPPLTVASMADALGLDGATRERVAALLDSLQPEIARAAAVGPDSLRGATMRAHARLMEALPPDRRAEFQRWLDARHAHMLERMHHMMPGMMGPGGRPGMSPGMGPGMMRPGSAGVRPGGMEPGAHRPGPSRR
jgi:hypothetical protein